MPSRYKFLNKPEKPVSFIMVCSKDERGGYVDKFFDENWEQIGWQPSYPELDDETSRHYTQSVLDAVKKPEAGKTGLLDWLTAKPTITQPHPGDNLQIGVSAIGKQKIAYSPNYPETL